jgi:hypothetical protein
MKMKRIADLWQSYLDDVMPKTAGPVQIQETRRAFYAGAGAVLANIVSNLTEGPEAEDEDLANMDAIAEELEAFKNDIRAGKA